MFRPAPRTVSRTLLASHLSKQTVRRGFASERAGNASQNDTSRAVSPTGRKRLPFLIGGIILLVMVPGRYILASSKPAGSGAADIKEARKGADPSKEFRDPRDSGVKTLEQKKQREQNS